MSRITPMPMAIRYVTLDEIAECWEGISASMQSRLWDLIPPGGPAQGEWPEPDAPDRVHRGIRRAWPKLSEGERATIIRAAMREEYIPAESFEDYRARALLAETETEKEKNK